MINPNTSYALSANPPDEFLLERIARQRNNCIFKKESKSWFTTTWVTKKSKLIKTYYDPEMFIGCRFGRETYHAVIDIDWGSKYHPTRSSTALDEIKDALAKIGIEETILIRSSNSGGLHLYIPLPELVTTFALAQVMRLVLEEHGFEIKNGQLEILPNVKSDMWGQYQGFRLPLQQGSYLLDADLEPYSNSLLDLEERWYDAAECQDMALLHRWMNSYPFTLTEYLEALFNCFDENGVDLAGMRFAENRGERPAIARMLDIERADHDQLERRFNNQMIQDLINSLPIVKSVALQQMKQEFIGVLCRGFTSKGQTNDLFMYNSRMLRIFFGYEAKELAAQLFDVVTNLPGYDRYSSHSAKELAARAKRTAEATIAQGYYYYRDGGSKMSRPQIVELPASLDPLAPPAKSNLERVIEAAEGAVKAGLKFEYKSHFVNHIVKEAKVSRGKVYECFEYIQEALEKCMSNEPVHQTEQGLEGDSGNIYNISGGAATQAPPGRAVRSPFIALPALHSQPTKPKDRPIHPMLLRAMEEQRQKAKHSPFKDLKVQEPNNQSSMQCIGPTRKISFNKLLTSGTKCPRGASWLHGNPDRVEERKGNAI